MIIDNVAENFQLQPENGICIKSWMDDKNDQGLIQLEPIIKGILYCKIYRNRNSKNS